MEVTFDKTGSGWNNHITPKQIQERQFNPAKFLLNVEYAPLDELREVLFSRYRCVLKFVDKGYNNEDIWVGRTLVTRKKNSKPITLTEGVKLIAGVPYPGGGSNKYPRVCFHDGWCVLEFISDGIPTQSSTNGWVISEVIEFEKLAK